MLHMLSNARNALALYSRLRGSKLGIPDIWVVSGVCGQLVWRVSSGHAHAHARGHQNARKVQQLIRWWHASSGRQGQVRPTCRPRCPASPAMCWWRAGGCWCNLLVAVERCGAIKCSWHASRIAASRPEQCRWHRWQPSKAFASRLLHLCFRSASVLLPGRGSGTRDSGSGAASGACDFSASRALGSRWIPHLLHLRGAGDLVSRQGGRRVTMSDLVNGLLRDAIGPRPAQDGRGFLVAGTDDHVERQDPESEPIAQKIGAKNSSVSRAGGRTKRHVTQNGQPGTTLGPGGDGAPSPLGVRERQEGRRPAAREASE